MGRINKPLDHRERKTVFVGDLSLSNSYPLEAMMNILVRKDILTRKEVLDELEVIVATQWKKVN